jgi:lipopolysaccharide biosynthesis glycosyltransferase
LSWESMSLGLYMRQLGKAVNLGSQRVLPMVAAYGPGLAGSECCGNSRRSRCRKTKVVPRRECREHQPIFHVVSRAIDRSQVEQSVTEMQPIHVGFCCDSRLCKALTVAACNLLASVAPQTSVVFHCVFDNWSAAQIQSLRRSLDRISDRYELTVSNFDERKYAGLARFGGGRTCYAVFDLFEQAPHKSLVYLDCDTVPNQLVLDLAQQELQGNIIGAVSWGASVMQAQEREFYLQNGMPDDAKVFNSGVMKVDCDQWRESGATEEAVRLGEKFQQLVTGDQTLLNGICRGQFADLDWSYNVRVGASRARYTGCGIVHFVGKPKPWTLSGRFKHGNYHLWSRACGVAGQAPLQLSLY